MENWYRALGRGAAIVTFLLVNIVITLAMVLAPPDSAAMKLAGIHKEINLLAGIVALGLALWRRWYAALFLFSLGQLGIFLLVVEQVNKLSH